VRIKQYDKVQIQKGKNMKKKRLTLCAILLLGIGLTGLQAQESINATGGNASGSGGSVSYSVGQVVYNTNTGTNGSVAQGVQQAFEISVVSAIEETEDINLTFSAFPNPTNDFLQLKVENETLKDLSFQLYDVQGKLLQNKKITENQTNIDMSNLVSATYLIKIIQSNNEIKTFKIIKN